MYVPRQFKVAESAAVVEILEATDFAVIVTNCEGAWPQASHLPILYRRDGNRGYFLAHMALANRQHGMLDRQGAALVICEGPHGYISPSLYQEADVPTWDYIAVHAYCSVRLINDPSDLEAILAALMERHEGRKPDPVSYSSYRAEFVRAQLPHITGLRLQIDRLEASFKLSQNRTKAERLAIIQRLRESGDPGLSSLAYWIERVHRSREERRQSRKER